MIPIHHSIGWGLLSFLIGIVLGVMPVVFLDANPKTVASVMKPLVPIIAFTVFLLTL